MSKTPILAIAISGALSFGFAHAEGADTENGELAFYRNCASCHSLEKGENMIGPSLYSVYERKSAQIDGYAYSPTLRKLDLTWSEPNLDAYITDSQKFAPGAKMWLRLPDGKTRRDIIGFLKTLKPSGGQ